MLLGVEGGSASSDRAMSGLKRRADFYGDGILLEESEKVRV